MGFYESTVLIVEDSPAITMILSKYVKKIGFSKIISTKTGDMGISKFEELLEMGIVPLVFLDYELPDMNASEITPILFSKTPEVKIILETSMDKDNEIVRNLFSLGVSHFVSKPLRFENIKQVVDTIKTESELDENVGLELDKISEYLQIAHRASVTRIAQNCGFASEHVLSFLRGSVSKGQVMEMNSIKEILCNECNSVNISTIFSCPKCTSNNFDKTKLIEHYDCGAIQSEKLFENNKCPQCKKDLKALGVDYKIMSSLFTCNECTERFPDPNMDMNCIKCGNKFTFTEGNWINSPTFMWMKEVLEQKESTEITNDEIMKMVTLEGFDKKVIFKEFDKKVLEIE